MKNCIETKFSRSIENDKDFCKLDEYRFEINNPIDKEIDSTASFWATKNLNFKIINIIQINGNMTDATNGKDYGLEYNSSNVKIKFPKGKYTLSIVGKSCAWILFNFKDNSIIQNDIDLDNFYINTFSFINLIGLKYSNLQSLNMS